VSHGASSPWKRRLYILAAPTLNRSALPIILLVVLASSIGGDHLLWNRFAVQTTATSELGKFESNWQLLRL